jgi:hypothetical protein
VDLPQLLILFLAQETKPQLKSLLLPTDGQLVLALMQVLLKTLEPKFLETPVPFMLMEPLIQHQLPLPQHLQLHHQLSEDQTSIQVPLLLHTLLQLLLLPKDQTEQFTMKEDLTHHQESFKANDILISFQNKYLSLNLKTLSLSFYYITLIYRSLF